MEIRTLDAAHEDAYERFVSAHAGGLLYASTKYKRFLTAMLSCEEHYLIALRHGDLVAALPLMCRRVGHRRLYNSLPFFGSHGGILSNCPEARQRLEAAYNDLAADAETLAATVIENPFAGEPCHFTANHADSRLAQWTPLLPADADMGRLLARIDSSARRNVQKATREGVVVEKDDAALGRLRELHLQNMGAMGGRPKSDDFFRELPRHFAVETDWDLFVAKKDGHTIAALLVLYYGGTVEYFVPAVDEAQWSLQPLALLIATAMAEAARRGFTRWNWGGTWPSQTGVYRFKKKWASREKPYRYFVRLNDPAVLRSTPAELAAAYPNFYVVPYSALQREAA